MQARFYISNFVRCEKPAGAEGPVSWARDWCRLFVAKRSGMQAAEMRRLDDNLQVENSSIELDRPMGARILELLFLIRSSGNLQFREALQLKEIDFRIVGALGRSGPLPSLQLASALGISKSQTSHATSALVERGLISRAHHRAPFELTPAGMKKFSLAAQISLERKGQITSGMDGRDILFLSDTLKRLMTHGEAWLAKEQRLSAAKTPIEESFISTAAGDLTDPDSLVPKLLTMAILMQRATFLQWKRAVGISPVDWITLSRVAELGSLRFGELVYLTARDKGQISRTVRGLVESGLLVRSRDAGSRDVELQATSQGLELYRKTAMLSDERDQLIAADIGLEAKHRFETLLEKMTRNAAVLLDRYSKAA